MHLKITRCLFLIKDEFKAIGYKLSFVYSLLYSKL